MQSTRLFWAALFAPACLFAQNVTTEGSLSVAAGGALHEGDRPSYQKLLQQRKTGFGGIEDLRITREDKDSVFKFNAKLLPGDDKYAIGLRYEVTDRWFVDAGFSQFRVWYDGSGGYFRPTGTEFTLFNEDLSLVRGKMWVTAGAYFGDKTLIKVGYQRLTRDGTKSTTYWADSNLVAPAGNRGLSPGFYDLDEVTDVFTFDLGNESKEDQKWNVSARYAETTFDNKRWNRRRPFEPTADRQVTTKDQTKTDLFSAHAYYLKKVSETLTVSAGALRTDLDSAIAGSRIYGQSFDPVYDPAYIRRQQRDEGYRNLHGSAELNQTVLNLNVVYVPAKNWSVRPSLRFENLHQEAITESIEVNVAAAPAFAPIIEDLETEHKKSWDEFSGEFEVRYTGVPDWTFSAVGLWVHGSGDLEEKRYLHHRINIDRTTDNDRRTQKYALNANWYAKPGLTFASQYYFKNNINDYDAIRDSTPAGTADRYPAFITDQDFETHDFNFRISWRPVSLLSLITRYDYQKSTIVSKEHGLAMAESSQLTSHIISQTATWSPTGRLYLTANVNLTYDQMRTPAFAFVTHGDNNYVNGSIGGGYALAKLDDIYFDYSFFRAKNYVDNSTVTLPYGADQKLQAAYLTWVRRQSEHLIYTVKYGYVTNRDGTWVGRNDFDAHVIYAKVQYHF